MSTSVKDTSLSPRESGLPRGTVAAGLLCAAAVLVLLTGAVVVQAKLGGRMVSGMHRYLSEDAWKRGLAFEKARQFENAKECYRQALETPRFESEANHTDALMRLGRILWWSEGPEQALPYLEQAYLRPDHTIWMYEALCDSLYQLKRYDEAREAASLWFDKAKEQGEAQQCALAKYHMGRILVAQGDKDAGLAAFVEGCEYYRSGRHCYEAALLFNERGEWDETLKYIDMYLEEGSGDRAEYLTKLRREIRAKKGS